MEETAARSARADEHVLVLVPPASRTFDRAVPFLGDEPVLARSCAWSRRLTLRWRLGGTLQKRQKPIARSVTILRLCTVHPADKNEHPIGRHVPSGERDQPLFTSSGRDDLEILTRNSTAVATLLTFWPPGPSARTKRSLTSPSSSTIVSVTRIIGRTLTRSPERHRMR